MVFFRNRATAEWKDPRWLHRTTYGSPVCLCFVLELKQHAEASEERWDVPLLPPATLLTLVISFHCK